MVLPKPRVWCWAVTSSDLTPIFCRMTSSPFSQRHVLCCLFHIHRFTSSTSHISNSLWIPSEPREDLMHHVAKCEIEDSAPLWCFGSVSSRTNVAQHTNEGGIYCSESAWCWASLLKNSWEHGLPFGMDLVESLANSWQGEKPSFQGNSPKMKSSKSFIKNIWEGRKEEGLKWKLLFSIERKWGWN